MTLLANKHADEIREMWQSRVLRASQGMLRKVIICALAKEYPQALVTLMKVTFEGFIDIDRPVLASYAHITATGHVVCDVIDRYGAKRRNVKIFDNEQQYIYQTRKLADELKLNDADRTAMFGVLQKWVASDRRQKLVS